MSGFVDIIEGVEKFLLGGFLAGDELDIVHQKQIHIPVFLAEFLCRAGLDGFYHLVGEFIALDVCDLSAGLVLVDVLSDGQQ